MQLELASLKKESAIYMVDEDDLDAEITELKKKLLQLEAQQEDARKAKVAEVVASIRAQINELGLKPADLFPEARWVQVSRSRPLKKDRPAKYRNGQGEVWSGGPGRKPRWVREVEARGEDISKYLIV